MEASHLKFGMPGSSLRPTAIEKAAQHLRRSTNGDVLMHPSNAVALITGFADAVYAAFERKDAQTDAATAAKARARHAAKKARAEGM